MYKVSPAGQAKIKQHEGCRLKAYKKGTDKVTIGYGNTYYEDCSPVQLGDAINQDRADKLFFIILAQFEKDVNSLLKKPVTQNQFDALISFAFNVGSDIDADTKAEGLGDSTLLKLVNANPSNPAIRTEFMKWISKGTIFEKGLKVRRASEADQYFS